MERSMVGIALLAALVKDKSWDHENEWRYLAPGGIGPLRVPAPAITEVIIGHRARKDLIATVVEVCRERQIPINRTRPDHASRTIIVELYEWSK